MSETDGAAVFRPPTSSRQPEGRRSTSSWWWAVLAFFAIPIALYAASLLYFGPRMFAPQLKESFLARPWGIYPHVAIGAIALVVGPFQFNRRLLLRRRRVHRVMGRIYVTGALLTGVVGTYMAWYAFGGPVTQLGFAGLGISLLFTTIKAFTSIKAGDVASHRRWMIRSFALLFGAVTLRIELPILVGIFGAFEPAYRVVAWSSWVPNLLAAEAIARLSVLEAGIDRGPPAGGPGPQRFVAFQLRARISPES